MSDISNDHNKFWRENTLVLIWVAISSLAGISIIAGLVVFFTQPADIIKANVKLVIANRNFTDTMLDISSGGWMSIEKPFCAEMDIYYQYSDMGSYYLRCKLRSLRSSDDPKGLAVHITLDFQRTITTKNPLRIKEIIMLKSGRHISHTKLYLVIRNFWVYLQSINVDIKILPIPETPFDHSRSDSSNIDVPISLHTKDRPSIQSPVLTDNETYVSHNMSINASLYLSRAYVEQTTALLNGKTNRQSKKVINNIKTDVSRVSMLIQTSFLNIMPSVSERNGMQDISILLSHYDTMHSIASGGVRLFTPDKVHTSEHFIPRTITTEPIRNSSISFPIMTSLMGESTISPTTVDNTMSSSPLGPNLLPSQLIGVVSTQKLLTDNSSISFSSTSYKTPNMRDAPIFYSNYYINETHRTSTTFTDISSTIPWDFETVYSSFNKINNSTAPIPLHHVPNTKDTTRSLEKQSSLLFTIKTPVLYKESEQPLHENIVSYLAQSNSRSSTLKVFVNYQPLQEVVEKKVNPSSTSSFHFGVNSTNRSSQDILVSPALDGIQAVITRNEISSPRTIAIEQSRDVTEGIPVLRKEPNPNIQELLDFRPNIDLGKVASNNVFLTSQKHLNVSDNHKIQFAEVKGIAKLSFIEPIKKEFTLTHVDGLEKMGVPIPIQSMPESVVMQVHSENSRNAIFNTIPFLKTIEDIWEKPLALLSTAKNTGALLPSIDIAERTEIIVNSGINTNVARITSHTMKAHNGLTSTSTSTPRVGVREKAQNIDNSTKGSFENANNHGELGPQLRAQSSETSSPNPYEMTLHAFVVQSGTNNGAVGPFAGYRDIIHIGEIHPTNVGIAEIDTVSSGLIPSSNFKLIHPVVSELNVSKPVVNSMRIDAQIYLANEFPIGSTGSQLKTLDKRMWIPNNHVPLQSENSRNQETAKKDIISGLETDKATNPVSMNSQNAIMNAETNTRALLPNVMAVKGNEMTVNSGTNTTVAEITNHAMKAYNAPTNTSTLGPRRRLIETKQSIVNSAKDIVDNVNYHGKLDPQLGNIGTPDHFKMTTSAFEVQSSTNNGVLEPVAGYKDITYNGDILHTDAGIVIAERNFSNVIPSSNFNLTQPLLSRLAVRKPALTNLRIDAQSLVTKVFPIGSTKVQLGTLEKFMLVPINQSPFQIGKRRPAETAINGIVSGPKKDKVTNLISWNSQNVFMKSTGLQNIITTGMDSRLQNKRIHSFQAAVDEAGEANLAYIKEQSAYPLGDNWNTDINNFRGIGHKHMLSLVERENINEIANSLPQQAISKLRNTNLSNFLRSYSPDVSIYQTYVHPMITEIWPFLTVNGRASPQLFQFPMALPTRSHLYTYPKQKYLRHQPWQKTTIINHLTYIKTFSYGSITSGFGRYLLSSPWKKFVKVNGHDHILHNRINSEYTNYGYGDYIRKVSTLQSIF